MQVESELEMATHEIEMLTKRIEQGDVNLDSVCFLSRS
jgi:exonuclease VII small subunit